MINVKRIFLSLILVSMAATASVFAMEQNLQSLRDILKQSLLIDEVGCSQEDATNALIHATDEQVKVLNQRYNQFLDARIALANCKKASAMQRATECVLTIQKDISADIASLLNQARLVDVDDWVLDDSDASGSREEESDVSELSEEEGDLSVVVGQESLEEYNNDEDEWLSYLSREPDPLAQYEIKKFLVEDEVLEASNNNAIVVYKNPSEIVGEPEKSAVKVDVSLALKLVQEMESQPESLLSKISGQYQNSSATLPVSNIVRFGELINNALEAHSESEGNLGSGIVVENVLEDIVDNHELLNPNPFVNSHVPVITTVRDENGNIIAELSDGNDDDNPPIIEVPIDNPPIIEVLVVPEVPATHSLMSFKKPLVFGILGVCGVSALCWKLYKNSSYYQCALLKKWQNKVANAIAGICAKDINNVQMPVIEVSRLTRLTVAEREQLGKAHDSLLMAFDKACKTVGADAATGVASRNGQVAFDQTPVVKELKVAHAQWDTAMNDCKNSVQKSSMRFW